MASIVVDYFDNIGGPQNSSGTTKIHLLSLLGVGS